MTTHGLRFAKDKDLKKVESHYRKWSLHKAAGKYVPGFIPNKDEGEEYNPSPKKIHIKEGKMNKDKVEDKEVKSIKGDDKEEDKGEEQGEEQGEDKKEDDDSKKRMNIEKEKENYIEK
ncbi:uncharacterized protein FFB14_06333 [Fusarium fujikuroi]|nr:uncharacterized protein FFB14_06333 [Fusarium fujikuroi]